MKSILLLAVLLAFQIVNASEIDELLTKAEAGDPDSQYMLGMQYKNGLTAGRDKSDNKAQEWLALAADYYAVNESSLSPSSLHNLSVLYEQGLGGLGKDLSKAHELLSSAAHGGDMDAQQRFGMKFEDGKYLEQDISKAKHWYTKAAKQGHFYASYKLGMLASSGLYVEGDQRNLVFAKLAMNLILESPFQAIDDLVNISKKRLKCESLVSDSYVTSYMWFQVAKTSGLGFIVDRRLEQLAVVMSADAIEKSEALAAQCVLSKYQNCRYNLAPVNVVHNIESDLIKSEDIIKSSSCRKGDDIVFKYLYSDEGLVFQQYKGKGELESEFAKIGENTSFKAFDKEILKVEELVLNGEKTHKTYDSNGSIASEYEFDLISEVVKSKLNLSSEAQFKKIVKLNYNKNGLVTSKIYYGPVVIKERRNIKEIDQDVDSAEYFDKSGKLIKKAIYKRNRPHWEETYKEDGSLGRKYRVR